MEVLVGISTTHGGLELGNPLKITLGYPTFRWEHHIFPWQKQLAAVWWLSKEWDEIWKPIRIHSIAQILYRPKKKQSNHGYKRGCHSTNVATYWLITYNRYFGPMNHNFSWLNHHVPMVILFSYGFPLLFVQLQLVFRWVSQWPYRGFQTHTDVHPNGAAKACRWSRLDGFQNLGPPQRFMRISWEVICYLMFFLFGR